MSGDGGSVEAVTLISGDREASVSLFPSGLIPILLAVPDHPIPGAQPANP
jgi:hypothetical protein